MYFHEGSNPSFGTDDTEKESRRGFFLFKGRPIYPAKKLGRNHSLVNLKHEKMASHKKANLVDYFGCGRRQHVDRSEYPYQHIDLFAR